MLRRLEEHARAWLATGAIVGIIVETAHQRIYGDTLAQGSIDRLDGRPGRSPAGYVGLVGEDHHRQASPLQGQYSLPYTGEQLELSDRRRRNRHPVALEGTIQGPVSIEKDGRLRLAQTTDSHFVGADLSRGSETSRCQITPWIDSAWGVTWAGLTVGTRTHASATRAV